MSFVHWIFARGVRGGGGGGVLLVKGRNVRGETIPEGSSENTSGKVRGFKTKRKQEGPTL